MNRKLQLLGTLRHFGITIDESRSWVMVGTWKDGMVLVYDQHPHECRLVRRTDDAFVGESISNEGAQRLLDCYTVWRDGMSMCGHSKDWTPLAEVKSNGSSRLVLPRVFTGAKPVEA